MKLAVLAVALLLIVAKTTSAQVATTTPETTITTTIPPSPPPTIPSRYAAPCPVPMVLHGTFKHQDEEVEGGKTVVPGSIVYLTCEEGYYVSRGSNRSACLEIGWEPDIGMCAAVSDDFSECGFRSSNFQTSYRDTFDSEAIPGEYPWMAKLEVEFQGQSGTSVCGAALIARNWMLTSAHCLRRAPINGIAITMGQQVKFNVFIEPDLRRRNASRDAISVIYHPLYQEFNNRTRFAYDFALIRLQTYAKLNEFIRTICLPDLPQDLCRSNADLSLSKLQRENCREFHTAGWGSTEVKVPQTYDVLKRTEVELDNVTCRENLTSQASFCVRSKNPDLCLTTPGAPLMCVRANRFYLVGVFSHNPTYICGRGQYTFSDVYFRSCEVMYWIRVTIGDMLPTTTTPKRIIITRSTVTRTPRTRITPPPTVMTTQRGVRFMRELGEAAAGGNLARVRDLLNSGADVNGIGYPVSYYPVPCDWSWRWPNATALIWATGCNRSSEVLKILLDKGAWVNYRDLFGMSAVVAAGYHGNVDNLKLLLDRQADINLRNQAGDTALIEASSFGYLDAVRLLLERGADVDVKNTNGETALFQAVVNDRLEVARLLIENDADVGVKTLDGVTALMKASTMGSLDMVRLLVDNGAYLDSKDSINRFTALMYAARNNRNSTISFLIERGANRDGCDHQLCRFCGACNGFVRDAGR